jgi:hypothetical protein
MKIEFNIFNREFFRTLTFSLKFQKKAQVSIIYMKNICSRLPFNSTDLMFVIAQSAVLDSQDILTTGMKLRIIFLLHNTSSSRCTGVDKSFVSRFDTKKSREISHDILTLH